MSILADGHGQGVNAIYCGAGYDRRQGIPGLNARAKPRGGVTRRNIPKWEHSKSPKNKKRGLCREGSVGNYGGSIKGSGEY